MENSEKNQKKTRWLRFDLPKNAHSLLKSCRVMFGWKERNGRNKNLIAARRFHHHQHSNVDPVKMEIWVNTNIMPRVTFPRRKFQERGFPKGCTVEKRGCN